MTFSNTYIETESLPALEDMPTQALSGKYRPTNIILTIAIFGLLAIIMTAIRFQPLFTLNEGLVVAYPVGMAVCLTLGLLISVYHYFADPLKRYALREQDISFTSGLFFRKTICQPILRIQHIEVQRGPIERLVGLASLQVFSAGGATHTFEIPGLEEELAQQMRQFILDHKDTQSHG